MIILTIPYTTLVPLQRDLSLQIEVQASDGNCLFRSVAHQVYGDPNQHKIVRAKVCDVCCVYIFEIQYT